MIASFFIFSLFTNLLAARSIAERNYCKANGFDSNVLECSTCQVVKDYIPDNEINEICMKCCNNFKIVSFSDFLSSFKPINTHSDLGKGT